MDRQTTKNRLRKVRERLEDRFDITDRQQRKFQRLCNSGRGQKKILEILRSEYATAGSMTASINQYIKAKARFDRKLAVGIYKDSRAFRILLHKDPLARRWGSTLSRLRSELRFANVGNWFIHDNLRLGKAERFETRTDALARKFGQGRAPNHGNEDRQEGWNNMVVRMMGPAGTPAEAKERREAVDNALTLMLGRHFPGGKEAYEAQICYLKGTLHKEPLNCREQEQSDQFERCAEAVNGKLWQWYRGHEAEMPVVNLAEVDFSAYANDRSYGDDTDGREDDEVTRQFAGDDEDQIHEAEMLAEWQQKHARWSKLVYRAGEGSNSTIRLVLIDQLDRHFPDGPEVASFAKACYEHEGREIPLIAEQHRQAERFEECVLACEVDAVNLDLHLNLENADLSAYGGAERLQEELADLIHRQSIDDPMRYFGPEHQSDRPNFRKPEAAPEFVPSHRALHTREDIESKKLDDLRVAQETLYDRRAKNRRDPFTLEMDLGDDEQKMDGEWRAAFENRQPELGRTGEWSTECFGVEDEYGSGFPNASAARLARQHFTGPGEAADALKNAYFGDGKQWGAFEKDFKAQNPGLHLWYDDENCRLHAHNERRQAKEAAIEAHFSRQGREGGRSM